MKLSTEELKKNPHLLRLLSDEDLTLLGINPESIRPSTTDTSPTSIFSEKALRELKGKERAQHLNFANWLNQNHPGSYIHAATYKKVHDLPPGWPDFTLFKPHASRLAKALFIEFKSPVSGFLSPEQNAFRQHFHVHICYSALDAINLARDFFSHSS